MMGTNRPYLPESFSPAPHLTPQDLTLALESGTIVTATPSRCDLNQTLHIPFGVVSGILPREELSAPWLSGAGHHMAVLSRVGVPTCFCVTAMIHNEKGDSVAVLSRKIAQEQAMEFLLSHIAVGQVLPGVVTHLASFGTFVDIGCGITALLPLSFSSVSRVRHPKERFFQGQKIRVAIQTIDPGNHRFTLTHKELLGTWLENASYFTPGETVQGVVRSVQPYGCFVELSPNLCGLSEVHPDVHVGDCVSVYIKSIRPEGMKIKLQIIQTIAPPTQHLPLRYFITDGTLGQWQYAPTVPSL